MSQHARKARLAESDSVGRVFPLKVWDLNRSRMFPTGGSVDMGTPRRATRRCSRGA